MRLTRKQTAATLLTLFESASAIRDEGFADFNKMVGNMQGVFDNFVKSCWEAKIPVWTVVANQPALQVQNAFELDAVKSSLLFLTKLDVGTSEAPLSEVLDSSVSDKGGSITWEDYIITYLDNGYLVIVVHDGHAMPLDRHNVYDVALDKITSIKLLDTEGNNRGTCSLAIKMRRRGRPAQD